MLPRYPCQTRRCRCLSLAFGLGHGRFLLPLFHPREIEGSVLSSPNDGVWLECIFKIQTWCHFGGLYIYVTFQGDPPIKRISFSLKKKQKLNILPNKTGPQKERDRLPTRWVFSVMSRRSMDVPARKLGSMVIGSMGDFTYTYKWDIFPLEVLVKGWDQWVITPRNIPFIGRL